MIFDRDIERNLRRNGVAVEEFDNGFRASDPFLVATRWAFQLGRTVFPAKHGTKRPLIKWSEGASADLHQIFQWQQRFDKPNYCSPTGNANGFLVLDFDGTQGAADFCHLQEELGSLPPTIKVTTGRPSGGFHLYFEADPQFEELKTVTGVFGCSVDVRGGGGMIVMAASLHPAGPRYYYAPGCAPDEINLARLPKSWFDALPKRETTTQSTPRSRSHAAPPHVRIANAQSAIIGDGATSDGAGGGFHGPIYKTAIELIRLAGTDLDEQLLVEILKAQVLNAPASPDRDPNDLIRYSSDSYLIQQVKNARAWCLREHDFK